jgi:hypothetical protein
MKLQFFAKKDNAPPNVEWVRVYIDEQGIWAIFGDSLEDVLSPCAEVMNITTTPSLLEGFTILKIEVYP